MIISEPLHVVVVTGLSFRDSQVCLKNNVKCILVTAKVTSERCKRLRLALARENAERFGKLLGRKLGCHSCLSRDKK